MNALTYSFFYVVFHVANRAVMLCGCLGLLCSLFGQFISLVISNDLCVGSDFADGDIVVRCS